MPDTRVGITFGHEFIGVVEEVGPSVQNLKPGDRVKVPFNIYLHPDNPITETGITAELTHHGLSSRVHHKPVDLAHQWIDPILVAGPWALTAVAGYRAVKGLAAVPLRVKGARRAN